ncbi:hypothetical protein T11_3889 [Trichinella zimbabwensis]|uniref:Uncharacterized protein n=1 Tax=Trichinella zimbabwensis TaxID=268475 RepID=A0A0V1GQF0_9BILA|nr:hypothetical protein T11_3889 [Trichinella zimbabwensis]
MGQWCATEACRNVAVCLFPTGLPPLQVVELVALLLDEVSELRLSSERWKSAIASAFSQIKRWKAVKSDRNFSSAFTSLSHSSLLAAACILPHCCQRIEVVSGRCDQRSSQLVVTAGGDRKQFEYQSHHRTCTASRSVPGASALPTRSRHSRRTG